MKTKGFTLIEIISVIVILGIIITIATVAITNYVAGAKMDTYASVTKQYAEAARGMRASDKLVQAPKDGQALIIPVNKLEVEEGKGYKSPYGKLNLDRSYIVIVNEGNNYSYYIATIDVTGMGINFANAEKVKGSDVTSVNLTGIKSMKKIKVGQENIKINNRNYALSSKDYKSSETILLDKVS